jgi:cell pole-organizing protein PopZ
MEEILASIRRILNEDEAPADGEGAAASEPEAEDDVLVLDRSMLVSPTETAEEAEEEPVHAAEPEPPVARPAPEPPPFRPPPVEPLTFEAPPPAPGPTLVAPETAAAAQSSVDGLLRTLAASRSSQVYRGGPTIEDLVREEIRPLLKDWLDNHLPPLVERLVRAEIERVVGRAVS